MGVLYSNGTIELLQDMVESNDIIGILHVGDISYADDRMPYQYEEIWDMFFDRIEPISSRIPYMVCPVHHLLYFFSHYIRATTNTHTSKKPLM